MSPDLRDVDPGELCVPSSRSDGPDPFKLQRQVARFGGSSAGMPPIWVYESTTDGGLMIFNGVTRAYRIAKHAPGTLVTVEVVGKTKRRTAGDKRIKELLP